MKSLHERKKIVTWLICFSLLIKEDVEIGDCVICPEAIIATFISEAEALDSDFCQELCGLFSYATNELFQDNKKDEIIISKALKIIKNHCFNPRDPLQRT